jgi:hypothetical protein
MKIILRPSTFLIYLGILRPSYIEWTEYPLVNHVKYLGVIFDERNTWKMHVEITEAKAFRTFIRIYFLFKSEHSSANIKLTFHKALIRSGSRPRISGRHLPLKIAVPAKRGSP